MCSQDPGVNAQTTKYEQFVGTAWVGGAGQRHVSRWRSSARSMHRRSTEDHPRTLDLGFSFAETDALHLCRCVQVSAIGGCASSLANSQSRVDTRTQSLAALPLFSHQTDPSARVCVGRVHVGICSRLHHVLACTSFSSRNV